MVSQAHLCWNHFSHRHKCRKIWYIILRVKCSLNFFVYLGVKYYSQYISINESKKVSLVEEFFNFSFITSIQIKKKAALFVCIDELLRGNSAGSGSRLFPGVSLGLGVPALVGCQVSGPHPGHSSTEEQALGSCFNK